MPATLDRTSTIPASPEVVLASVRGVDPDLVADITDARRRLDRISPAVIALLLEVARLEGRMVDVANEIDCNPLGASHETWARVSEVTGARELAAAASKVASAYPVS